MQKSLRKKALNSFCIEVIPLFIAASGQSNPGMDRVFVLTEKSFSAEKGLSGLQIFSGFLRNFYQNVF